MKGRFNLNYFSGICFIIASIIGRNPAFLPIGIVFLIIGNGGKGSKKPNGKDNRQ